MSEFQIRKATKELQQSGFLFIKHGNSSNKNIYHFYDPSTCKIEKKTKPDSEVNSTTPCRISDHEYCKILNPNNNKFNNKQYQEKTTTYNNKTVSENVVFSLDKNVILSELTKRGLISHSSKSILENWNYDDIKKTMNYSDTKYQSGEIKNYPGYFISCLKNRFFDQIKCEIKREQKPDLSIIKTQKLIKQYDNEEQQAIYDQEIIERGLEAFRTKEKQEQDRIASLAKNRLLEVPGISKFPKMADLIYNSFVAKFTLGLSTN